MRLSDLEPVFQDVLKPDVIAPVVFVGGLRLTIATLFGTSGVSFTR